MAVFRVLVPVLGFVAYKVEAENPEKAKEAVLEGCGEFDSRHSESSESADSNSWKVDCIG